MYGPWLLGPRKPYVMPPNVNFIDTDGQHPGYPPPLILFLPPTLSYRVNLMCVSMCVIPEVTQRVSSVLSFLRIPHPHPRCLLELHLITCATLTRSAVQGGIAITAGRVWNLGLGIWIWES